MGEREDEGIKGKSEKSDVETEKEKEKRKQYTMIGNTKITIQGRRGGRELQNT